MTAEATRMTYTPAEYLARERLAETKSEYRHGEIVAMTGASRAHNRIALNIATAVSQQLRGSPCEPFMSDMRVRVSHTGLYTYPDVVVACAPIQFDDDQVDTLLNPVVVIEVLSTSTEAYDRGEKFRHFRRLDSLQAYVLVAQDLRRVERYERQGDQWVLTELSAPDDTLSLAAIDCAVSLRDIYDRVAVPESSQPIVPEDEPPPTG